MIQLFVAVLNMSITASIVVLVLLILRGLALRRLPATFCYLLWGTVLFRLLVPWSLPGIFSIFNLLRHTAAHPEPGSYVVAIDYAESVDGYFPVAPRDTYGIYLVLATIWLTVVILLLLYSLFTYLLALRRTRTAFVVHQDELLSHCKQLTGVRQQVTIYRSPAFDTPVVMGLLHPRIVLPAFVDLADNRTMLHILIHELTHIKRGDHLTKMISTTAFLVHWFNPLLWLCARLLNKDIETSCDEQVLHVLGEAEKADYADSLLRLCAAQRLPYVYGSLAFGETAIKRRVYSALNYKRLSRTRTVLLSLFVLAVGLVTTTNPVEAYNGYRPLHNQQVSLPVEQRYEQVALALSDHLRTGDAAALLALSGRNDPYHQQSYQWLVAEPLAVQEYKLYPQSDTLAYCYLRLADDKEYVAELVMQDDTIVLATLRPEPLFRQVMTVPPQSEPVRFVRNLYRFGIYTGFNGGQPPPRPAVAALCIDEEYRDRVKTGEHNPDDIYLPPEWIAQAAKDYFGIEGFSYTFDESLYSSELDKYIYNKNRGATPKAEVLSEKQGDKGTILTTQLYQDPLLMVPQSTITYTLQKKK